MLTQKTHTSYAWALAHPQVLPFGEAADAGNCTSFALI
jgi:hypothetical protein